MGATHGPHPGTHLLPGLSALRPPAGLPSRAAPPRLLIDMEPKEPSGEPYFQALTLRPQNPYAYMEEYQAIAAYLRDLGLHPVG